MVVTHRLMETEPRSPRFLLTHRHIQNLQPALSSFGYLLSFLRKAAERLFALSEDEDLILDIPQTAIRSCAGEPGTICCPLRSKEGGKPANKATTKQIQAFSHSLS